MAKTAPKLTTLDLVFLAQTTPMTIYNWRKGSARKTRPLPTNIGPRGEVSFSIPAFSKWCTENGVELVLDPHDYLEARANYARRKPGPKATAAPAEKSSKPKKKPRVATGKGSSKPAKSI